MPSEGRPNYWETFKPVRVPQGEAVGRTELIRRLAHYLHVPQRFGYRLMLAFERVFKDAMQHGEGLNIAGAGTLTLQKHDSEYYTGFGKTAERTILFRYDWRVSKAAKRFLKMISDLERKGKLDDTFQKPKD